MSTHTNRCKPILLSGLQPFALKDVSIARERQNTIGGTGKELLIKIELSIICEENIEIDFPIHIIADNKIYHFEDVVVSDSMVTTIEKDTYHIDMTLTALDYSLT